MDFDSFNGTSDSTEWLNETTLWAYIEEYRGSQQQPLNAAIPLTVINCLIFITGITGNVGVCIVIHKNSMLHTATHYFLFNLAVADLLLLLFGLPNDVALYWHQYPWVFGVFLCKLRGLISEMASYVSVMTIVVFSTERYLAICHPLYIHTLAGLSRALKVIGTLWIVAFVAAIPFYQFTDVHYLIYPTNRSDAVRIEESALCAMIGQPANFPLIEMSFGFFFVFPLLIIVVQYIKMSSSIASSEKPLDGICGSMNGNRLRKRAQSNKSIVRMLLPTSRPPWKEGDSTERKFQYLLCGVLCYLEIVVNLERQNGQLKAVAVVVGFFCCWAPFHAQRLVIIYASDWEYIHEFNVWMFFATGILYYFSSTLNPILYNVMSKKMRKAFKNTFRSICCKTQISRDSNLTSTTTFHGRRSRSFREENQLILNRKASVKKGINFENDLRSSKRISTRSETPLKDGQQPYLKSFRNA